MSVLEICIAVIVVMLAVMTIITYYFHEKSRFRREYVHEMSKTIASALSDALALSEIGKSAKAKAEKEAENE